MAKSSLIISVYNNLEFLKLVFAGIERQSFRDFEIIVADDGSAKETVKEFEKLFEETSYSVTHLWQDDRGFRKNRALNKAVVATKSDYLIFIDGDCVPHSNFILEHYANRKEKTHLSGRRVDLSKKITSSLTPEKVKEGYLEKHLFRLFLDSLAGDSHHVEKGIYFRNPFLRKLVNKKKRGILGCNFSCFKNDLLNINGFDERYESPSIGEDTDVQFRLELTGIKIKMLNNIAIQYHLYHTYQKRQSRNLSLFNEVKKSKISFTPFGITNNS